jgi:septal ring factor EnvC (AmiA/AmiB activator)
MWKLVFIAAALCFSASPLDAAAKDGKRIEKTQRRDDARRDELRRDDTRRNDLRRDVDRISREIYQPRRR